LKRCTRNDWESNAFELEKSRITDPKRIETMLILVFFAYVLCVFGGERREKEGEVQKPPKGKDRVLGLSAVVSDKQPSSSSR
jgi:hypothetical protein